jgi:hypothetical protein
MATLSNVSGIIPSLKTAGGCTILRFAAPTKNAYGTWDKPAPTAINLTNVVIHNLTGRDLDQVPEANRNIETIEVYTLVRLYVADGGNDADIVVYRGRKFKVITVNDYELQGGVYCAIAQLIDKEAQ